MRLQSAVGAGSTFSIYLARVPAAPPAPAPGQAPAGEVNEATILLVEDEPWMRQIAEQVLAREGYRVLPAGDAVEAHAIVAARTAPVDLLLTDVVMPGISGPRLATQLREAQPALPVLFISGYASTGDPARELEPNERLLRKPFTPFALVEAVRSMLAGVRNGG
jgi:two-component system cell cycle sensor histidine kinase/response regulator CckA